jgi:hypothetical protein
VRSLDAGEVTDRFTSGSGDDQVGVVKPSVYISQNSDPSYPIKLFENINHMKWSTYSLQVIAIGAGTPCAPAQ